MKKNIFVFGNEYFEGDELAIKIVKEIKNNNYNFIIALSPNEILKEEGEIIILDVVKGIKEIKIIEDIDDLILENSVSCHDLDLAFYLKLMKECGKINKIKIIGLPFGENNSVSLLKNLELILENNIN